MAKNFHIARKQGGYEDSRYILACGTNRREVVRAAVVRWNEDAPDSDYPATASMLYLETVPIQSVIRPER